MALENNGQQGNSKKGVEEPESQSSTGHGTVSMQTPISIRTSRTKDGKDPQDYRFWNTQPVPRLDDLSLSTENAIDVESPPDGAILPLAVCEKLARAAPGTLVEGFEWCEVDVNEDSELLEVHNLLYDHYVEDDEGSFRLNYSMEFLSWALKPPGWTKNWHIGVRTKAKEGRKGKLVAFVAGVPITLGVRKSAIKAAEINFLTVHQKLRGKRLAPILIKEITRRCYLGGIYQALYTAGTVLPSPVSTCRYYHRSLDWEHLYNTGFSHLPRGSTVLRQTLKYKLERKTSTKGLRKMESKDIPMVLELLNQCAEMYSLRQKWTEQEVTHHFCSDASRTIVSSFVVEEEGRIKDFVSYYLLEVSSLVPYHGNKSVSLTIASQSTVLRATAKGEKIRTAYLYYYATEAALKVDDTPQDETAPTSNAYQAHLQALMHDMLILAKLEGFHVFNALTIMDSPLFLKQQKFEPGDSNLHFYLFNWRTAVMANGMDGEMRADPSNLRGIGVVML
ncbi:N-myristoyl transferase [Aureobasidium subglaciale]|nr:N-myristoyl transferase [Aureobasidium subglaciale]